MNSKPHVLFISNGAGEDAICAQILKKIKRVTFEAMPLVGEGSSYEGIAPLCGPRKKMPSGGLIAENWLRIFNDLASGLGGLVIKQLLWLRRNRNNYREIVAVGDLWPVIMAILSGIRPITFIGTAKSDYHHAYSALEAWALRTFGVYSLVRDEQTAKSLRAQDVKAKWVGNAMMDGLEPRNLDFSLKENEMGLAMFPGSRQAAYGVLPRLIEIARKTSLRLNRPLCGLIAAAPSIDAAELAAACSASAAEPIFPGWQQLIFSEKDTQPEPARFFLIRDDLAGVLRCSSLALGLAGTAHEQAAGWGIPVVAYEKGGEKQMKWYRSRQKGLLGDALTVAEDDDEAVIEALIGLINDPAERKRRGDIGRVRLGPPGGAAAMAQLIELLAEADI
ncbi:lipid-A-disaccharide synthase-related protein [bacterium]|nr:lipid-A-disaccharide synthase-related protein [bacterium]